ncbi:hypothetical protein LINPERHAP1_LOCUS2785 [Linum perenne]
MKKRPYFGHCVDPKVVSTLRGMPVYHSFASISSSGIFPTVLCDNFPSTSTFPSRCLQACTSCMV